MSILYGEVQSIRHNSGEFYIFSFEIVISEQPKVVERIATVRGHLVGLTNLRKGVPLQLMGEWVVHPKYGRQLSIHGWKPWARSDQGIACFLQNCVPGFYDSRLVDGLVSLYGTKTFSVLGDEPDRVLEDLGPTIHRDLLEEAILSWDRIRAAYELAGFLQAYDVPSYLLKAVLDTFGTEAGAIIEANPYRLLSVQGFKFSRVDQVARNLGVSATDPRRYEGAVMWILQEATQSGHLYARRPHLAKVLMDLTHAERSDGFGFSDLNEQLQAAVDRLQEMKLVQVDPEAGVYLPSLYRFERTSAQRLVEFMTPLKLDIDLDGFIDRYQKQFQVELSNAQREAVEKLISNKVLVLTGLPGTGKTFVTKTFVRLFKEAGLTYRLMAPTGIAAKRLEALTGESAATVHRTLRYDGESWGIGGADKLPANAVIVDECSMVDQELFFRILDGVSKDTILVFVGDDAQLPSVGPGNVLRELINCPAIPTVRLTEIFRQSATSSIVLNAHRINRGESVPLENPKESEFQFVHLKDEERTVELIVKMALKLKSKDANFQVLAPKYDGIVGVDNLNESLREALNPSHGQGEVRFGEMMFREGDRLMVTKNDYKKNVYNGDVGKLSNIGKDSILVRVHGAGLDGTDALIPFTKDEALRCLRLAYAITVHRCQGSEFGTIIMPISQTQGRMLQRNLLYTSVTRAKSKVWLIGDPSALAKAIANDKDVLRNTALGKAIVAAAQV